MQKPTAVRKSDSGAAQTGLLAGVSRVWRIFRTGLSFVSLAGYCLALALVIIPLLHLWPGTRAAKEIRAQKAIHLCVRAFMRGLQITRVARIEIEGGERLAKPGQLVVANHPSLLDAFLLITLMPQADCVIKGSHIGHPILGGPARGAGYIPNWSGPGMVEECVARLRQGRSLIVFPEGTRSPVGGLGPFARGAAHIALRSGTDPIPVTIECDPATLYRGKAWWDVPPCRFTLRVRVGEPLSIDSLIAAASREGTAGGTRGSSSSDSLSEGPSLSAGRAARVVTHALRDYFERAILAGDTPSPRPGEGKETVVRSGSTAR